MPLALGPDTERAQTVVFDPAVAAEAAQAAATRDRLLRQGFRLTTEEAGCFRLAPPPRGPHCLVFRTMTDNGDDRVVWDRTDPAQVKEAYAKYTELTGKGYTPYAVGSDGKKAHRIDAFDPGLSEILFVPSTKPG